MDFESKMMQQVGVMDEKFGMVEKSLESVDRNLNEIVYRNPT